MAILEKFTISAKFHYPGIPGIFGIPPLHLPDQTDGLTKFHNCGQISQSQPNFTILEYLEYLELGQFCNFCDVLQNENKTRL